MIRLLTPLLAFLALVALLIVGMESAEERTLVDSPLVGRTIPSFSLPKLHYPDEITSTQSQRGQVWVLNVWGSWCQSCRIEHPWITELAENSGVPVVGFNWKDERDNALRWLSRFGDPWSWHMVDFEGRRAIDLGVYGAPETFIIDHRGIIIHKHIGPIDQDSYESLKAMIEKLKLEAQSA